MTGAASSITQTSATLNATVNPNGGEVSECKLEYGTTTAYGSSAPCTPSPGSGESPVAVSASVTGLTANTTYHFRISATNAGGTSKGSDQTFKTLLPNSPHLRHELHPPENIEGSFSEPNAVAVDPSGNIWVADSGHNRVLEFNKERKYVRQFGSEGSGEGQFRGIGGIATDASGDVYVTGSSRVQEFSPSGAYLRQFGSPGSGNGQFLYPSGIAVDSSGNVWVLDTFNYRVQEFSPSGAYLGQFGSKGTGNGQLGWASGLAFSGGNLYVAEQLEGAGVLNLGHIPRTVRLERLRQRPVPRPRGHRLRPDHGQPLRLRPRQQPRPGVQLRRRASSPPSALPARAPASSRAPRGSPSTPPATSTSPTPPTTGCRNGWRRKSRRTPHLRHELHRRRTSKAASSEPNAVAVDPSGNIWVADSGHNRVLEFNSERKYVRQFGTEGSGEGQFRGIGGIATDASGDVYVTGSSRVQEFSPSGAFLRQFGSPGSGNGQFLYPSGIAVDSSGNVWVLDTFNYRVQEFSSTRRIPRPVRLQRDGQRAARVGLRPRLLGREPVCRPNSATRGCRSSQPRAHTSDSSARTAQATASSTASGHRLRPDHGQPLRLRQRQQPHPGVQLLGQPSSHPPSALPAPATASSRAQAG